MINLHLTLQNTDAALLPLIAQRWGVDVRALDTAQIVTALHKTMLDPERAARVWDSLDDAQRGAVQSLNSSKGKMPKVLFDRLFGEIRKMGAGRIEREKPHLNPSSVAEALFYTGLIAEGYEQNSGVARAVLYVPTDLLPVLPLHKTTYSNLADDDEESFGESDEKPSVQPMENAASPRAADTSIVDDLTTLLAYLQLHNAGVDADQDRLTLAEADCGALMPHLLNRDEARLAFLLAVGVTADLIELKDGRAMPNKASTRKWLPMKRAEQLKTLVQAWRSSTVYRDLWWVSGLRPENPEAGGMATYDPSAARKAVIELIADLAPRTAWWSLEEFIYAVKSINADFQRSDYESWYIRNDADEYLRGFESWDAVEGALLEFYLMGPMHWLGLVDLGDDAARLTAYGRAFVTATAWPQPQEQEDKVIVQPDGTLNVSRRVPRIDRFQAARFSSWGRIENGVYTYRIDSEGLKQAGDQGVDMARISDFLLSAMGKGATLPPAVARALESAARGAPTAAPTHTVTLERVLVLRTTAPEIADFIMDTPALRRFLGARLGPMALIVRADDLDALKSALLEKGIRVEVVGN